MSTPIAPDFRAQVTEYRQLGFSLDQIAILLAKPKVTCWRAAQSVLPPAPPAPHIPRVGERQTRPEDLILADLTGKALPLETLAGTVWTKPVRPRGRQARKGEDSCTLCVYVARCREAVARGDLCACERVLQKELL